MRLIDLHALFVIVIAVFVVYRDTDVYQIIPFGFLFIEIVDQVFPETPHGKVLHDGEVPVFVVHRTAGAARDQYHKLAVGHRFQIRLFHYSQLFVESGEVGVDVVSEIVQTEHFR